MLFKDHTILINSDIKTILGLILRNVHCAQVALQNSLIIIFISVSLEQYVSKYVNRFELYLVWNKCVLNILLFY